ncbi:unnamed protein product [Spodoptera littoralis]|uniref:BPTI/Kunitz inhibitor domain-containing protein n=1 Tax=Spodoptera littoralis TaxID=7109 RepID=A0A9P0IKE7_SPOLI|nr:unnamed protein product [Spodoptera littoralis]CAH1647709.1 unnamed protein product [Spodoptera littoralis]
MNVIVFLVFTLFLFDSAESGLYNDKVPKYIESHELSSMDWYVRCKLQPNGFDCNQNETNPSRFYYDNNMKVCRTFEYGECELSFNTFHSLLDCSDVCSVPGVQFIAEVLPMDVGCRLQPDFGACNGYFPLWYFDVSTRKCKGFSYSGCGGNQNKFTSAQVCSAICLKHVAYPKRIPIEKKLPKKKRV